MMNKLIIQSVLFSILTQDNNAKQLCKNMYTAIKTMILIPLNKDIRKSM